MLESSCHSLLITQTRLDLLHAISFDAPLHFIEKANPVSRAQVRLGREGNFFASSPLLIFNDEDYSSLSRFINAEIAVQLAAIIQQSFNSIEQVYHASSINHQDISCQLPSLVGAFDPEIPQLAEPCSFERGTATIILHSCAICSRILFRTLERLNGLDSSSNLADMRALYCNLKFLGLGPWSGLPYIYAWLYVTPIRLFFILLEILILDLLGFL